jgi:sec-independent protein translocase protein TatB
MDLGFFGIGTWELLVIGLIALVVLGPKQMILLARKAGELLRQFQLMWQEASKTIDKELKTLDDDGPDLKGLGKEFQSLADEMKNTLGSISIPGIKIDNEPTIRPPATPPPTTVWERRPRTIKPPNGNGAEAKPAEQAADSSTSPAPAATPEDSSTGSADMPAAEARSDESAPKYSAWSNKKPTG